MSVERHLSALQRECDFLARTVEAELDGGRASPETVLDRYVEMRRNTASAMRELCVEWLHRDTWRLDELIERVERELQVRLVPPLPSESVRIRGYRGIRLVLFEYLVMHIGEPVSVGHLRALTGDQIHTERRLRELRDLGVRLEAVSAAEDNLYVLESEEPDLDHAGAHLATKMVREIPGWSGARRRQMLAELETSL